MTPPAHRPATRTRPPKWQAGFLAALAAVGTVRAACAAVGVSRSVVYDRRKACPAFAAEWDDASESGVDELVYEARKRAMTRSDTLLMFLIKAARPEYRDNYKPPPPPPPPAPTFDVFDRIDELMQKHCTDTPELTDGT